LKNLTFDSDGQRNCYCGTLCKSGKILILFSLIAVNLSLIQNIINNDIFLMHLAMGQSKSQSTTVSNNNSKSSTQQWVDKKNNMRIQFNNLPQSPVVDAKTQLRFSVQNITNSKNINDLHARVVVTTNSSGQMRIFKFENISSSKGDFSVNYFFPDSGVYQIMTRVDTNNLSTLGSFKVAVPFQPFGTITAPTPSFSLIIIAGIVIAVAAVSLLLVVQRRQKVSR
jgi:hypothetical protein